MSKKIMFIFVVTISMLFSNDVYANTYDISLKTNVNNKLKSGDIVELYAGIGCASNDDPIFNQKFTLILDRNIFELIDYSDNEEYKLRNGWNLKSFDIGLGQYNIEIESTADEYNITETLASENCLDSINAELVSFKFKVKDVKNQTTKIQLINQISYIDDLDFTIYNSSSNNLLSSLSVENYELDSGFNKNNTEYEVYVPYDTEKVNILATTEDSTATLSGVGEKQLSVGENKINLLVVAEDGSKKTYVISVIRKSPNDDTSLSKILVTDSNKQKIDLLYDEETKTYTGNVSSEIIFVSFDIKCSGEGCFVDELDSESLIEGENKFKFTVVSQNGDNEEYQIIINKEFAEKDDSILFLSIGLGVSLLLCIILLILYLKSRKK